MKEEMTKFLAKHKSAKNGRVHGLGAGIDLGDKHGNFLNEMHKPSPGIKVLKDAHIALGLTTLYRGHIMHCCPPLIIKPEQIREGFEILDKSFDHLDRWIEEQD